MNSFTDRFNFLLEKHGLSNNAFAKKIGVSTTAIRKISLGETSEPKKIVEIANAFGVDVQWLKTGDGIAPDFSNKVNEPSAVYDSSKTYNKDYTKDKIQLKQFDISASGGYGAFNSTDVLEVVSLIEYSSEYFQATFRGINPENVHIINVKGDSMSPTLESGDLIYVDVKTRQYDGDGVYVFSYDDTLFVKRLQKTGNKLTVISDNPAYEKWYITENDESQLQIVGKVLVGQSQKMKMFG